MSSKRICETGGAVCLAIAAAALSLSALSADSARAADAKTSFFITSVGPGDGANLGGLEGADAHCAKLAEAAGIAGKTWHAYLSTFGPDAVNARDRIGKGPWYNAKGAMIARDLDHLHSEDTGVGKQA